MSLAFNGVSWSTMKKPDHQIGLFSFSIFSGYTVAAILSKTSMTSLTFPRLTSINAFSSSFS